MVEWKALRVTQAFLKAFFNFPDLSKRHISSFFFTTGSFTNPERTKKKKTQVQLASILVFILNKQ